MCVVYLQDERDKYATGRRNIQKITFVFKKVGKLESWKESLDFVLGMELR